MTRRASFYLPPEAWSAPFTLGEGESRHLAKVLRLGAGDEVRLFDGEGHEGLFRILRASAKHTGLELVSERIMPRPPGPTLALGWNKSTRRDMLLEKAVELGASGIVFWPAERSQGRPPDTPKSVWTTRLVAAAKQCGAAWLPHVTMAPSLNDLLEQTRGHSVRLVLWEEVASSALLGLAELRGETLVVIGPEGGLSRAEARAFTDAGFAMRGLGANILRWETAALLCLSMAYMANQAAPQPPRGTP